MTPIGKVSRRTWIELALSALLYVGISAVSHWLRPVHWVGDPELAALTAERGRLRESDDATRDALRAGLHEHSKESWTPDRLEKAIREKAPDWQCQWQASGPAERLILLTHAAVGLNKWPALVAMVRTWAGTPGIMVDSVEFTAQGRGHNRQFTRAAIALRFTATVATKGNAERSAPSGGPLPVAAAGSPAMTRNVGPVPSLRLSSASAQPPASGPASAPVRPDPPGPRAGAGNPTTET